MQSLIIRPWQSTDAPALLAAVRASLAELSEWLPWCHANYGASDAEQWIAFATSAWAARREFPFGIFDATDGRVLGGTGINQINTAHRIGNLGYWVATPETGGGIARTAARHALAFAFGELALARVEIVVMPDNIASRRVADALGARRECLARNRVQFRGRAHDALVYSLVPDDAAALAAGMQPRLHT